jgi:hypothetical protein
MTARDAHISSHRPPRRRRAAVPLALLLAAALAGCGGSSGHRGSASDPKHPTITFPIKHETHADIVAAVESCREGVALATWLPAAARAELDESCNKGLTRGLTEVRQYGEQVCSEVVFTMPASRAAEKQRIFDACEAKTEKWEPSMHRKAHP